ncbi:MAG: CRISPR-associated protein Cas4 [Cetobacterium sp.]|uniref:CRISPR-associated protein Cas4 n=1 Tax=Cetobacterium sp. ZOR0034 TaxID=1339239 RepID=UPI000A57C652|nr:CRISPR-associated protein Cas4 [Cetobacterium sp. ZOR0034]
MHKITGIMFYYYFVCKRKLWLFSKDISFEEENENVILGKLLDESSYSKEEKHIMIDETINIDFLKRWEVLHEVKKSKNIEEASIWQVKYYLYFLKNKNIDVKKGIIDYPKIKEIQEVTLEEEDIKKIENILEEIKIILTSESPPIFKKLPICKSCAYFEYCMC